MRAILLSLFIPLSLITYSQCITSVHGNSGGGYDVDIQLNLIEIVAPNACPGGYNYNIRIGYNITFSGTGSPTNLYTLQGNVVCRTNQNSFFNLPNNGGSGTVVSGGNQWNPNTDCANATPSSLNCDEARIQINGPGMSNQTITVPCTNSGLPVEMTELVIFKNKEEVIAEWTTASEINASHFIIERSKDLKDWEEVQRIEAQGNSNTNTYYSATDFNPYSGNSYYRLVQYDFNGDKDVSKIFMVNFGGEIVPMPNPFSDFITLNGFDQELGEVKFYDLSGRLVNQLFELTSNTNFTRTYSTSQLPSGAYFVDFGKGNVYKILKQ